VLDLGYGYGYPLFSFYGPLPYYVGSVFHLAGMSATDAAKAMFAVGIILAAVTMYFLGRYLFGPSGGIVAAVFYLYAPYHAVQTYVRGAVGEFYAAAFLPLAVLGAFMAAGRHRRLGLALGVLGLAGVILSHTIYGYVIVGLFIAAIAVMAAGKLWRPGIGYGWDAVRFLVYIVVIALDLTAFFWLPAFAEMGATSVSKVIGPATADYRQHFVCPGQLWQSPWGFGGSAPGCVDGMSFKIGKLHVLAELLGLGLAVGLRPRGRIGSGAVFAGILLPVSVLATLAISTPVWAIVPKAAFIQYPWRFLVTAVFASSLSAALAVGLLRRNMIRWAVAAILIAGCVGMNADLFVPQSHDGRGDAQMASMGDITWRVSGVSDEYMPAGFVRPKRESELPSTVISALQPVIQTVRSQSPTSFVVDVGSPVSQRVTVNRAFFPGWTFRVNGKRVPPDVERGLPTVVVSQGTSTVEGTLDDTPVRAVGNVLSAVTAVLFVIILYGKKTHA
jgi:hypothetical protein